MPVEQGDVIRITAKMSVGVDDVQNVYHVLTTGSGSVSNNTATLALATWLDTAYTEIEPIISDEVAFDGFEFYNLTQDLYMGARGWPTLTAGAETSDLMPPQVAPFCLFDTDVLRSQGRKFLPPTTEGYNNADGTPQVSLQTAVALYAAEVLTAAVSGTVEWLAGNYRPLTATFIEWVSAVAPDFFATQRRRYFGRGS